MTISLVEFYSVSDKRNVKPQYVLYHKVLSYETIKTETPFRWEAPKT